MAKKDFHNFIEQQNPEEKEEAWRRLSQSLGEQQAAPKPKKKLALWKVLSVCIPVAACLAIGLGLGLGLPSKNGGEIADDDPPKPTEPSKPNESEVPDLSIRYCGFDDCEKESVPYTLKSYAQEYKIDLLYLDWYDVAEDYDNNLYTLIESGEEVCFEEFFADSDGYYVYIYVTDNKTATDFLTQYDIETGSETKFGKVSVFYKEGHKSAYANFEYKGYRYYLETDAINSEYILQIAEEMLSNIA